MKTAEEYLNSKGFYNTNLMRNAHDEEVKITDMIREYATESIKADREKVKRAIRYPLGFIDGKIANEERIDNLPIELK